MFGPDEREKWGEGVGSPERAGKAGTKGRCEARVSAIGGGFQRQLTVVVGTRAAAGKPSNG